MHIRRKAGADVKHEKHKHHQQHDSTTQPSSSTADYQTETGEKVAMASPTKQAVIWARKAKNGSDNWMDNCTQSQYEWYRLFKKTKFPNFCAKIILCVLTLFELPSTCKGTEFQCAHANYKVYSWNLPVIPIQIRMVVALCLYLFIAFRLFARMKSLGELFTSHVYALFYGDKEERSEGFEYAGWYLFQAIVCTLGTVFCIVTMVSAAEGSVGWLITIMCRPLLLVGGTKKLRQAFYDISRSVRGYAVVLAALLLSIWVFIWMGMILFARTPEGKYNFFSWADACAVMWILFTTSNDPNAWIPAYSTNRWSVFFFAIFLVLTIYLLLSLLLAKVYQVYQDIQKDNLSSEQDATKEAVRKAFHTLANVDSTQEYGDEHGIDLNTWKEFVEELCRPYVGLITCGDPEMMKHNEKRCIRSLKEVWELDGNIHHQHLAQKLEDFLVAPDSSMDMKLFSRIVTEIVERGMYIPSKRAKDRRQYTCCPESLGMFFQHGVDVGGYHFNWDSMVNCGIIVAMPITLWASIAYAYPKKANPIEFRHYLSFQLLLALSCLYTLGITLKISSLGYERFWFRNKVQHRFDFFNVYILFIAEILFFTCMPIGSLARLLIILHIFRGFRLLAKLGSLRSIFTIIVRLIPMFWQMFLVLFVVYYIFAVIGQYWFGGLIYTTNPVLAGTNFASAAFWPLNFNDLPSGFITLFSLMVVNNWYEIAQGYMFVTHSNFAASYFVVFFIVVNLIVLNIILALILDCTSAVEDIVAVESETQSCAQRRKSSLASEKGKENLDLEGEGLGYSLTASHVLRKALSGGDECADSEDSDEDDHGLKTGSQRSSRTNIVRTMASKRLDNLEYGTFSPSSPSLSSPTEPERVRSLNKKRSGTVAFTVPEGDEEHEDKAEPLPSARSVLTEGTNDMSVPSENSDPISPGKELGHDVP